MAAALLLSGCSAAGRRLPWRNEPIGDEVNIAFTLQNNLPFLDTLTLDGHRAHALFASANRVSALDTAYAAAHGLHAGTTIDVHLSQKGATRLTPVTLDLHGVADALLGADLAHGARVAIDYEKGLLTFQQKPLETDGMSVFTFSGAPAADATIDGRPLRVILDTALPDTLVLPLAMAPTLAMAPPGAKRGKRRVTLAGSDFGLIDVRYADVAAPRAGNRLLAEFFVMIDYRAGTVALWRSKLKMQN